MKEKTYPETFTESLLCLEEKIRRLEDSQYSVDFVLCLEIVAGNHSKSPAPTMTSHTIRGYELFVNQESDE